MIAASLWIAGRLLFVVFVVATAYALGRRLSLRLPFSSPLETIALSVTLGLGALGTLLANRLLARRRSTSRTEVSPFLPGRTPTALTS